MNQRRDDVSTADLAAQQPASAAPADHTAPADRIDPVDRTELGDRAEPADRIDPADRIEPADLEGRDRAADDPVREDLPAETVPDAGAADGGAGVGAGPLLASQDAEGFRARWTDVQAGFVDAPRQAVERADGLVAELMQHLAATFADERQQLERQWDQGDDVPTDDLRTAFQRYRSFFERLLAT